MFKLIDGGFANDCRGQIRFVNEFDMTLVKRFYIIKNANLETIRGWRGHRREQRWFYVLNGIFKVLLVKIDDWDKPDENLPIHSVILNSLDHQLLHVPPGYATAFKSIERESELLVFADSFISDANDDNYTFSLDHFKNNP